MHPFKTGRAFRAVLPEHQICAYLFTGSIRVFCLQIKSILNIKLKVHKKLLIFCFCVFGAIIIPNYVFLCLNQWHFLPIFLFPIFSKRFAKMWSEILISFILPHWQIQPHLCRARHSTSEHSNSLKTVFSIRTRVYRQSHKKTGRP